MNQAPNNTEHIPLTVETLLAKYNEDPRSSSGMDTEVFDKLAGKANGYYEVGAIYEAIAQKQVTLYLNGNKLGAAIGLDISAHDCRHYYATAAHRGGTDMLDIMRAGGWSSPAMVTRYVDNMSIGNINVRLG